MQVLLLTLWCRVDCTDLLTLQIQVLKLDKQQPYVSTMYHRHCLSKQIALWNSAKGYNIFQKFSHTSLIHRQGFEQGSPGVYSWWWFYLLKALTERLIEMNHRAERRIRSPARFESRLKQQSSVSCAQLKYGLLFSVRTEALYAHHTLKVQVENATVDLYWHYECLQHYVQGYGNIWKNIQTTFHCFFLVLVILWFRWKIYASVNYLSLKGTLGCFNMLKLWDRAKVKATLFAIRLLKSLQGLSCFLRGKKRCGLKQCM